MKLGVRLVAKIDKILSLGDGEHRFHFDVKAEDIGLNSIDFEGRNHFEKPISADAVLTKTNHVYYIKMKVIGEARLVCDRCLEDVSVDVADDFQVIYTDHRSERNAQSGETEIRLLDVRKENQIVLDKDIVDTIELAMPHKVLCDEDCKGLCVQCGANLNERACEHAQTVNE